jgi:hypothetical protein
MLNNLCAEYPTVNNSLKDSNPIIFKEKNHTEITTRKNKPWSNMAIMIKDVLFLFCFWFVFFFACGTQLSTV